MKTIRVFVGSAVALCFALAVVQPADALFIGGFNPKKALEEAARKKKEEAKRKAEEELKKKEEEAKQAALNAAKEFALGLWTLAKKKLLDAAPWVLKIRDKAMQLKDDAMKALTEKYEALKEKVEAIKEKGKEYGKKVMAKVEEVYGKLQEKWKEIFEKMRNIAGKVMETFKDLFEKAKAFGERVATQAKEIAASVQEKVQHIINKAKEKAHAAIELGKDLANRVTNQLKEGWDFVSTRAKELGGKLKDAALKLHAKFEAIKGEKLADLQRMLMAARLKAEALNTVGSKGPSPQPEVAGELYVELKKYIAKILGKMQEHGVQ
jgi:methyl-accepting chemotaxis protein